jgi:hypothetical protein
MQQAHAFGYDLRPGLDVGIQGDFGVAARYRTLMLILPFKYHRRVGVLEPYHVATTSYPAGHLSEIRRPRSPDKGYSKR